MPTHAMVRSQIDGRLLDAARLQRLRGIAQGCLLVVPAESGTVRTLAVPRGALPFVIPPVASGEGAHVVSTAVRMADGRGRIGASCAVPAGFTEAELNGSLAASAGSARWQPVWAKLLRSTPIDRRSAIVLSGEAIEARFELFSVATLVPRLAASRQVALTGVGVRRDEGCCTTCTPDATATGCKTLPTVPVTGEYLPPEPPADWSWGDVYETDPMERYFQSIDDGAGGGDAVYYFDDGGTSDCTDGCIPAADTAAGKDSAEMCSATDTLCLRPLRKQDQAALDSAMRRIDSMRYVSDSLGGNLCARALAQFAQMRADSSVFLGSGSAPTSGLPFSDTHDAWTQNGQTHFDQYYMDNLIWEPGQSGHTFAQLAELVVHEAMHSLLRADGSTYTHPPNESGPPYSTFPFSMTGQCVTP